MKRSLLVLLLAAVPTFAAPPAPTNVRIQPSPVAKPNPFIRNGPVTTNPTIRNVQPQSVAPTGRIPGDQKTSPPSGVGRSVVMQPRPNGFIGGHYD